MTKIALCHFVQMDKYEIPDDIAAKSKGEIAEYIAEFCDKPVESDTRDWEVVGVEENKIPDDKELPQGTGRFRELTAEEIKNREQDFSDQVKNDWK